MRGSLAVAMGATKENDCEIETRADGMKVFSSGGFREGYVRITKGVGLLLPHGTETAQVRRAVMQALDRDFPADQPLHLFNDLRGISRIANDSREEWGVWTKRRRSELVNTPILVNSKLIEMALSVMNMVMRGGMHSYSSESAFIEAIAKHSPSFRKLPTV